MPELVTAVGFVISMMSLWLMLDVAAGQALLRRVFEGPLRFVAALARLLFGAALIASAPTVAYSGAINLFGWLFALGALTLVVLPLPVIERVVDWYAGMSAAAMRGWLALALGFGVFLVYASLA